MLAFLKSYEAFSGSSFEFLAEAEKVVGWAKNHYLSSCMLPSIKGERLSIPRERYIHYILYLSFATYGIIMYKLGVDCCYVVKP